MSLKYDYTLPVAPQSWQKQSALSELNWSEIPTLSPFRTHDNNQQAIHQTMTQVCHNQYALYVRFDCVDNDIWGTYTERDDPIYDEEVVELFIGQGIADPTHYYEFEISPNGVLFDAKIVNLTSVREQIEIIEDWNCQGIQWLTQRHDAKNKWEATLLIPWSSIASTQDSIPAIWRANFYRIERPRDAEAEYSCWSPTMEEPVDFHKPAYFGTLRLPVR